MLKNIFSAILGFLVFHHSDTPMEIITEPMKFIPEPTQIPPLPTPLARRQPRIEHIENIARFEDLIKVTIKANISIYYFDDRNELHEIYIPVPYENVIGDSQEPLDDLWK